MGAMNKYTVKCADKPDRIIEVSGKYDAANMAHLDDVGGKETNLLHYMAAEISSGPGWADLIYKATMRRYRVELLEQ